MADPVRSERVRDWMKAANPVAESDTARDRTTKPGRETPARRPQTVAMTARRRIETREIAQVAPSLSEDDHGGRRPRPRQLPGQRPLDPLPLEVRHVHHGEHEEGEHRHSREHVRARSGRARNRPSSSVAAALSPPPAFSVPPGLSSSADFSTFSTLMAGGKSVAAPPIASCG